MTDLPDYELQRPPGEPPSETGPGRSRGLWIVVTALIAAAAFAAYVTLRGPGSITPSNAELAEPQPQPPPPPPEPEPGRPLGADAPPIVLPPLDQSDALVRELVRKITSNPRIVAWLATEGLIRNFTVVVTNVAEGKSPAPLLRPLRPSAKFAVVERGPDLLVDPRSYARYNSLAAASAAVDPAGAARLYTTLKPRIEEAHRDLGFPDTPFDRTLERAIVMLLRAPVLTGTERLRVEPRGIGYGFADPAIENLPPAQKQLLRTGPRNVASIQSSLRELALALGIPAGRLPAPRT
jgi:hypothetical protein